MEIVIYDTGKQYSLRVPDNFDGNLWELFLNLISKRNENPISDSAPNINPFRANFLSLPNVNLVSEEAEQSGSD